MFTHVRPITIKQGDSFYFVILSDTHIGSSVFAKDEFRQAVKEIKELSKNNQVVVLLNGDIIEAINTKDKRFTWDQIDKDYPRENASAIPQYQCKEAVELLEPIKDIIYYLGDGNHEESLMRHSASIDPALYLMDNCLGSQCVRTGYSCFLVFPIKIRGEEGYAEYHFSMAMNHGVGGGMLPGSSLNSAYKLFEAPQADIYVMSHTHHAINDVCEKYMYNPHKGFYVMNQHICCVGSFMRKEKKDTQSYAGKLRGQSYPISYTKIKVTAAKLKSDAQIEPECIFPSAEGKNNKCERPL